MPGTPGKYLSTLKLCDFVSHPNVWISRDAVDQQDGGIGKVGYEINFNREFFRFQPPRPLQEIDSELESVERRILELLKEVTE